MHPVCFENRKVATCPFSMVGVLENHAVMDLLWLTYTLEHNGWFSRKRKRVLSSLAISRGRLSLRTRQGETYPLLTVYRGAAAAVRRFSAGDRVAISASTSRSRSAAAACAPYVFQMRDGCWALEVHKPGERVACPASSGGSYAIIHRIL